MGKKGRRTRWRTLTIADEQSDSEESSTTASGHRVPKVYQHKSYYGRFTYSSQSTPTRRYQCGDGIKSTRSSSTASENKITFNEDEYTRITTPRQDVLFKKGYLNKPKTYQTQTSTGNSTTSTGNSTGNGTPDHQSTDLEYESQFVFPNGFVDQNGIYYVNSFEPYPVMVYNPPTYYPEYANAKSKRCSTGSLPESTSPNNEETSQDLSQTQSETPSNVSDVGHVYNVIYPSYFYNGACQPQEYVDPEPSCEPEPPQPRRVKKRRRRKMSSRSKREGTTTTTSESSDEVFTDEEVEEEEEDEEKEEEEIYTSKPSEEENKDSKNETKEKKEQEAEEEKAEESVPEKIAAAPVTTTPDAAPVQKEETAAATAAPTAPKPKYDLKPDAEEFVPRAYRHPHESIPVEQQSQLQPQPPNHLQFIKLPANFVPVPIMNPMVGGEFNAAFIPSGIPINFVQPNYVGFVPFKPNASVVHDEPEKSDEDEDEDDVEERRETVDVPNKNQIDIARIVSKLEEAAKEQRDEVKDDGQGKCATKKRHKFQKVELRKPVDKEWKKATSTSTSSPSLNSPKKEVNQTKPFRNYSDTLKKPMIVSNSEKIERYVDKKLNNRTPVKEVKNHQRTDKTPPKMSSEWIPVSSRKKRKNKNVEESGEDFIDEKVEEPTTIETTRAVKEEKEEVVKVEMVVPEELLMPQIEEVKPPVEDGKEEKKMKKKPKKGSAKVAPPSVTRRVMVMDVALSVEEDVVKALVEETKEEEIVVEKEKDDDDEEEEKLEEVEKVEEKVVEKLDEVQIEKKEVDKKSKKKKKRVVTKSNSQSSFNAGSNVTDDSYDFLLDESFDKTNVEVSQELDRMIQRGMYSSLEEKIKSMNIESNDNFFKTMIISTIVSSRESSVEKNSSNPTAYIKTTANLIPPSKRAATTAPKPADFLCERAAPEPPPTSGGDDAAAPTTAPNSHLYPITKAVKEWMSKARETTPDVELLKSPSAILREFGEEENEAEDEEAETAEDEAETAEVEAKTAEVEAKTAETSRDATETPETNGACPKHGDLPYRAICCSIM